MVGERQVNSTEEAVSNPPVSAGWPGRLGRFSRGSGRLLVLVLAVLGLALLGATVYALLYPPPTPLTTREVGDQIVEVLASATAPAPFSAQVYQTIFPSLVYIQALGEDADDQQGVGVGSGVVINSNGDILTAYHVVAGARKIEILYADGTEAEAEISGSQAENDIAVLHPTDPPGLIVPAVLASLAGMRVGDQAFAVGNPLGLPGSMSAGVISGFDRTVPVNKGSSRLEGLIQFDAAVNPGNSGGPLLNRQGQVIGIVTALANPDNRDSFSGIGFAVPIATAMAAAGAPPF